MKFSDHHSGVRSLMNLQPRACLPHKCKRHYYLSVYTKGRTFPIEFDRNVHSSWALRPLAVILFRKWFGHEPKSSWVYRGHSGATDLRGNEIFLEQYNPGSPAFIAEQESLAAWERYHERGGPLALLAA